MDNSNTRCYQCCAEFSYYAACTSLEDETTADSLQQNAAEVENGEGRVVDPNKINQVNAPPRYSVRREGRGWRVYDGNRGGDTLYMREGDARRAAASLNKRQAAASPLFSLTGDALFQLAPNGKASKLNHAQWYTARTPFFRKSFGEWEAAALIKMAERVWNGGGNKERFNFAPSEKLKAEIKKLTGHSLEKITITDSDIRHIKDRHGKNQAAQGQVDITPEDIALIPFVMNEFDSASVHDTINTKDGKQISRIEFTKQIDGTAVFASIERYPEGKTEQAVTLYIKKGKPSNAAGAAPEVYVQNAIAQDIIQRAADLRNALKNTSNFR